jgi:ribosomal protein S18 acetylase RimI-like enzyme
MESDLVIDDPGRQLRLKRLQTAVSSIDAAVRSGRPISNRMMAAVDFRSRIAPRESLNRKTCEKIGCLLGAPRNHEGLLYPARRALLDLIKNIRDQILSYLPESLHDIPADPRLGLHRNMIVYSKYAEIPLMADMDEESSLHPMEADEMTNMLMRPGHYGMLIKRVAKHEEIERRAYEAWQSRGGFSGQQSKEFAERDWIGAKGSIEQDACGFLIFHMTHEAYRLMKFVVDSRWKKKGLGEQMLWHMIERIEYSSTRRCIELLIRESDLPSQLFLRTCGFQAKTVLREEFKDTGEDAFIFRYYAHRHRPIEKQDFWKLQTFNTFVPNLYPSPPVA